MSHWVLQEAFGHESGWDALEETLERFDLPFSWHWVVPFVGDIEPEPEPRSDEVICIGSYSMRHYAYRMGWNPGVFDLEPHDFRRQLEHWGAAMLNADSEIVSFGDARWVGEMFVRPVHDSKVFTGRVFSADEFSARQAQVKALGDDADTSLRPETLIQVTAPKEIHQEVRCWVVEGQVVTASLYRVGGEVRYSDVVEPRLVAFAEQLAAIWSPEKAFCLDVCTTPDGLRIVEINTINSAGFYAADVQKLVMALDGLRR